MCKRPPATPMMGMKNVAAGSSRLEAMASGAQRFNTAPFQLGSSGCRSGAIRCARNSERLPDRSAARVCLTEGLSPVELSGTHTTPAMAFEGCGCRAAFHVGVAEWFAEHGLVYEAVAGASSGSLVAGAVALSRVSDLRAAWTALLGSRVCDFRRVLAGRWPFRMSEIVGGVTAEYFGDTRFADTVIPLSIVVTTLGESGFRRRILTAADHVRIADAMLASCFIPGPYSHLVPIDRRLAFDGAWLGRVPLDALAQLGCRRVIASVTDDRGRLLRGAVRIRHMSPPADIDCRVLHPIAPLPVSTFDFDAAATLETFAIGRESASAFARTNSEWLRR